MSSLLLLVSAALSIPSMEHAKHLVGIVDKHLEDISWSSVTPPTTKFAAKVSFSSNGWGANEIDESKAYQFYKFVLEREQFTDHRFARAEDKPKNGDGVAWVFGRHMSVACGYGFSLQQGINYSSEQVTCQPNGYLPTKANEDRKTFSTIRYFFSEGAISAIRIVSNDPIIEAEALKAKKVEQ